ncbi:MAG: hypothetical protein LLG04_14310 [Parachlamydia sp.]|nr:hypothetical protein [Parachlamydia sp.]
MMRIAAGQPAAASQSWAAKERFADGLDGIKNVALATLAVGVTVGSAYLVYNYSSGMGLKRSAVLIAAGCIGGCCAGIWKAWDAQRSFQSMWHGRAEMQRRDDAEWQRTKAAAGNWLRRKFI